MGPKLTLVTSTRALTKKHEVPGQKMAKLTNNEIHKNWPQKMIKKSKYVQTKQTPVTLFSFNKRSSCVAFPESLP